jgi:broad specificity phosphatase PhoE
MNEPVTRLFLLRHGETALPDRLHGAESDVGIGERGRAQAESAASWLVDRHPAALYSSTMRRARETAAILARRIELEPIAIEGIHERKMGALSGMPRDQGLPEHDRLKNAWKSGDLAMSNPGGESYLEIRDRALPALSLLLDRHRGESFVVVAHGVLIQVVLSTLIEGFTAADLDRVGIGFVVRNELIWNGSRLKPIYLNGEKYVCESISEL